MWIVDPDTRLPLPAFEASDHRLRRLGGPIEWLGEHDELAPAWERSTIDDIGFQYVRLCRRPCVHLPGRYAGYG